jgi:glycosyltransferase involved in cell wall biosynthesis
MKLCIITANVGKGDGQARVNYEIVKVAIQRKHSITLVVMQVDSELKNNPLVECVYLSVNNIPTELLRGIVFNQQSDRWLDSHRHEFDVIMACGAVTSKKTDVNAAHFVHGSWLRSPAHTLRVRRDLYGVYQWVYTILNSYWEKIAFKQSKFVVAVSERVKQELTSIGVRAEQVRVILNGVDLDEFLPAFRDRSQIGLPEGVTLAMFAGDIRTPRKNLDTVLYSLVKVPSLHLVVVGNTERSPYPQLAEKLGLGDRVHFLGYRRDISELMKAVDLFVFPSRYEACTLVLLEAMASGLPVITAVATGGAEIVTDECGIVLSETEDVAALADAMTVLSNDRALREKMGKAARVIAEQHSWSSKAKAYVDLFESLRS